MPEPTPYGLGRLQHHDPRSHAYSVGPWPKQALKPVDWQRRAPLFDQGQLGSCVGNAFAGLLATDCTARSGLTSVTVSGNVLPVDETLAVQVYSLATQLDNVSGTYPPDDTGSTGLGGAKALAKLGLAGKYLHAFTLQSMQTALQSGPVAVGIVWYNSMFDVDADGFIKVDPKSGVAGGHEFVISAWPGTGSMRYRMDNSWGEGWGLRGRAWFHETDMIYLLGQGGDVTQPVFAAAPAPTPAPGYVTDAQLHDTVISWWAGKNA